MVTQQITAIVLRILSIWLLIHLLLSLPGIALTFPSFEIFHQQETAKWLLFSLAAVLFALGLLAVFLLFKTSKSVLTHSKSDSPLSLSEDSQKVLFQLAGLYFVVNALAYFPRSFTPISSAFGLSLGDFLTPVGLFLQLLIGVWLASCSAFWLKLFQKLRGRG